MLFNNTNMLITGPNNGPVVSSLDSDPSIYSSESYQGPQEPGSKPYMTLLDLGVLKEIGAGSTSKTYLVKHKASAKLYALKVVPKAGLSDTGIQQTIEQQAVHVAIGMTTGNFLLPLIASWHDESSFYILTEYIRGGDLAAEVSRCGTFSAPRVRFYAAQLVLAVENLHRLSIVHGDVALSNILVDPTGYITLGDYGISTRLDEPTSGALTADVSFMDFSVDPDCDGGAFLKPPATVVSTTRGAAGTPCTMSPQRHQGREYSYDADIWGMGVVLYRMLMGLLPFGNDSESMEEMAHEIVHAPLVFAEGREIDPVTADLLGGLLAKDVRDRLTIAEIKAHRYFNDIDWFRVASKTYLVPWRPHIPPIPRVAQGICLLTAGAPFPVSEDPHPGFRFLAGHVSFAAPAPPDILLPSPAPAPAPAREGSAMIMENLIGRSSAVPMPAAALVSAPVPAPATANMVSASSDSSACGPARRSALRPLILPRIVARRTLESQARCASSGGRLSPIAASPPTASSAGSSPRSSLFTAISRSTTPTTASSLSPSPIPGSELSDASNGPDCAGSPPASALPFCPAAVSAGLRLRVTSHSTSATSSSPGLGIFEFTPAPLSRGPILSNTRHRRSAAVAPSATPEVPTGCHSQAQRAPWSALVRSRHMKRTARPPTSTVTVQGMELESAAAGQPPREIALGVELSHENAMARTRARLWGAQDEAWGIPAIEVDRIRLGSAWSADTIPDLTGDEERDEEERLGLGRAVWGWARGLWALRRAARVASA